MVYVRTLQGSASEVITDGEDHRDVEKARLRDDGCEGRHGFEPTAVIGSIAEDCTHFHWPCALLRSEAEVTCL